VPAGSSDAHTQLRRGAKPVAETDSVFRLPSKVAEIARKDAAFAGLAPQRSPTSRRVDFYALRKSCARILINLGLHPKVIQQTLRHADIRLTMDLYGEFDEDDLFRELPGKFPVPRAFAGSSDGNAGAPALVTAFVLALGQRDLSPAETSYQPILASSPFVTVAPSVLPACESGTRAWKNTDAPRKTECNGTLYTQRHDPLFVMVP